MIKQKAKIAIKKANKIDKNHYLCHYVALTNKKQNNY